MTLDETFNRFIDARLEEIFGPNFRKIRDSFNELIRLNKQHSQKIDELEKNINEIAATETMPLQRIDRLERASQEFANLQPVLKSHGDYIVKVNEMAKRLSQRIEELEKELKYLAEDINVANGKNKALEKKIADLELKNESLSSRNNEYELKKASFLHGFNEKETVNNKSGRVQSLQADSIISKFNDWAANPIGTIPQGFTFLAGDFRIRTQQQAAPTTEETKWIANRTGEKKYLFPNPNWFNQMTDIRELYDMDQSMLKEKGRNKIKIITPCEISTSGWIEFAGELKILP